MAHATPPAPSLPPHHPQRPLWWRAVQMLLATALGAGATWLYHHQRAEAVSPGAPSLSQNANAITQPDPVPPPQLLPEDGPSSTPPHANSPFLSEEEGMAERGDIISMIFMYGCLRFGIDTPKDPPSALRWLHRAAEVGHPYAQTTLGEHYRHGINLPKTAQTAMQWFKKAAAQGDPRAMLFIGYMYENGEGVPVEEITATDWYRKAAEAAEPDAQYRMGWRVEHGTGTRTNPQEAEEWYKKSAHHGHTQAMGRYAQSLFNRGAAAEAVPWFQEAALYGDDLSQNMLAEMHLSGQNVPRDPARSWYFWMLAGTQGSNFAKTRMKMMRPNLSPKDIAAGESAAARHKAPNVPDENKAPDHVPSGDFLEALGNTRPAAWGSGFFIREDGYLLTTHRLATAGKRIRIYHGGRIHTACLIASDADSGQALLRVKGAFRALALADLVQPSRVQSLYTATREGASLIETLTSRPASQQGLNTPARELEEGTLHITWENGTLPPSCEGLPILLASDNTVTGMVPPPGTSTTSPLAHGASLAYSLALPAKMHPIPDDAPWTGWRRTQRQFDIFGMSQYRDLAEALATILVYD